MHMERPERSHERGPLSKGEELTNRGSLLMLRPKNAPAAQPTIDDVTRRVAAALRNHNRDGKVTRGIHMCTCGALSDNVEHWIGDDKGGEYLSNALAVHYVAYHREEVPAEEMEKIANLSQEEEEPTEKDLMGIGRRKTQR